MSEHQAKTQSEPEVGEAGASPPSNGKAFERAENLLSVDRDNHAHQAFVAIEGRQATDRQSDLPTDSEAKTQGIIGEEDGGGEVATDAAKDIDDALDEKALEDGVADANETAQIVRDLTPHNL